ncbi:HSP20 family molecular chaperone IbpA [Archangium gephyra]|uniref:HSP20 family molecular chaperone IbpA n=1 Tax=Archangium gephyra TaxID=48 RepID=A0AAC8Q3L6_9BACT|nr:Hsp20/alpha crystallin family protein [Archangium gephyra]AKI99873.1 heat shock protein, Hsp20 family [Archangium gephyra]REG33413.1 HSP20 family molecular chaperone IbpA [Archangium gephyra]
MPESIDLSSWRTGADVHEVEWREGRWAPATDVSESADQLLFEVELPGLVQKDIELTFAGTHLVLEGVRHPPAVEGRLLVAERQFGPFKRELLLPRELAHEPEAGYRDGVLTIRFAKRGRMEGMDTESVPAQGQWPPIDVLDTGHGLMLLADLPGVAQAAIDVRFEGRTLTLRGRREVETARRRYFQSGRRAGQFFRSILLPEGMDGDRIEASFKEGVLSVELPASGATSRPRKMLGRPSRSPSKAEDPLQQLRGELEELREQHQSLRNEVDGFWLALGCGLRIAQLPLHQHLPVEVSLRDGEPAVQRQVMEAVRRFVEFAGFEVWREYPSESGPFLERWQVRTRRKESQLELQQRVLRMQETLELARWGATQEREPRPEDFQNAGHQQLPGEAAEAWVETVFTLAQALRTAAAGASLLLGTLSLEKQEMALVLRALGEEELASRLRSWAAAD